jgi:hypothetical protein
MQPAVRTCDGCTLCCKVMGIAALNKPRGVWCAHCKPSSGCTIYDTRPGECRTFDCYWLHEPKLGPEWKPSKSRLVITTARSGNGVEIRCDPGYPAAWRKEPYYAQIREWARVAEPHDGMVLVCVENVLTLISIHGEFPLGRVDEQDRIERDYDGGRLVGVRVVKSA